MSEYGRSPIYIECHFKVSLSVLYFVYVCDRGMGYHCTLYEHLWHVCMWKNTRCYVRYWIGLNDTCGDWNVWHGRSHSFRTVNYSYNHLFCSDLPKLSVLIEQHVANFDNLRNFGVWTYSWKNISEKFYSSRDIELNVEKETRSTQSRPLLLFNCVYLPTRHRRLKSRKMYSLRLLALCRLAEKSRVKMKWNQSIILRT